MLIQDPRQLERYSSAKRLWQGIPSIEVTPGGRIFLTYYSGGVKEEIGNYVLLTVSNDGVHFSEPIAVAYQEGHRCFDPCLWIDPLGRLWFTWARCPEDGAFAAICEDPDAEEIRFGEEFFIGHNVMMNKPTVLSTGEWLFPIAVWRDGVRALPPEFDCSVAPRGSFVYRTVDRGKTFRRLGAADVAKRSFDEHMVLELENGVLRMFVRTSYGIGAADSYDGGLNWGKDFPTDYGGPCSRFFIRRLRSGRVLLINHYDFSGRNNLTALLSEDDGKTFPYRLLLDERRHVSYPDAKEAEDGYIYITYDRERGAFKQRLEDIQGSAREILIARITEEDILQGTVREGSYLKRVASKLGGYDGNTQNLFRDLRGYAFYLSQTTPEQLLSKLFDAYSINCANLHNMDAEELDALFIEYKQKPCIDTLTRIISLMRTASIEEGVAEADIVDNACRYILDHLESNETVQQLARRFNFSAHYFSYIFKKRTGTTVINYRNAQRLIKAKLLLRGCDSRIIEIAAECGFDNAAYFTELFTREVGCTPTKFREMN